MNYNKLNNIVGWAVFAIATITYFLTIEPTTSFWDCGEYIATSVKLQVGHPPGAPFFQLMGNLFGQGTLEKRQYFLGVNDGSINIGAVGGSEETLNTFLKNPQVNYKRRFQILFWQKYRNAMVQILPLA